MSALHGFLNIDKPAGPTSHDVVARIRRIAGQKRVGHAGTLDPAASGVLVVALGAATRLIEYVQDATSKRYLATVRLGAGTDTDDAEGVVISSAPVPALERLALETLLEQFRGPIEQVPPMYAALHHQGRRLHELARAGVVVERAARLVTIEHLTLLEQHTNTLLLDVQCSKGTYIRALARDIGAALGCGAHLAALRRTAVGTFTSEGAVPLDALAPAQAGAAATIALEHVLLPPERAVADWPMVQVDPETARRLRNGLPTELAGIAGERVRLHTADGRLLALAHRADSTWQPDKVFDWN